MTASGSHTPGDHGGASEVASTRLAAPTLTRELARGLPIGPAVGEEPDDRHLSPDPLQASTVGTSRLGLAGDQRPGGAEGVQVTTTAGEVVGALGRLDDAGRAEPAQQLGPREHDRCVGWGLRVGDGQRHVTGRSADSGRPATACRNARASRQEDQRRDHVGGEVREPGEVEVVAAVVDPSEEHPIQHDEADVQRDDAGGP